MAGPVPRPWFRLGSFTRPTTTGPVTEQQLRPVPSLIRPPLIRPAPITTDPNSLPTTPHQSITKSPPPVLKKEPSPQPVARPVLPSPSHSADLIDKDHTTKHPTPLPSPSLPMSIPPVPSPNPKSPAPASPPSPFLLPPPQLQVLADPAPETIIPQEVERKTVVFQKVMEKPSPPTNDINKKHEPNKNDINKEKDKKGHNNNGAKKLEEHHQKDSNTRFGITMAGENKGAFMEVTLTGHKNNDNNNNSQNEDKETNKKSMSGIRNVRPMKAFCNSNVQGVNNSILMNSEFSHHDPGIHLVFSRMVSVEDGDEDKDEQQQQ